ncbi:MAG: hypothetical protein CMA06_03325 [Euryarchaeota archaeon]|nr:hypothetical protein [Euryarchaeota archaeon]
MVAYPPPSPAPGLLAPAPPPSCADNLVWNQCGSACNATCTDPAPLCTQQCVPRCECPPWVPYWDASIQLCTVAYDCLTVHILPSTASTYSIAVDAGPATCSAAYQTFTASAGSLWDGPWHQLLTMAPNISDCCDHCDQLALAASPPPASPPPATGFSLWSPQPPPGCAGFIQQPLVLWDGAEFYGCYFFGAGHIVENTVFGNAVHTTFYLRDATSPPSPPALPPPARPPYAPVPDDERGPVIANPSRLALMAGACAWAQWSLTDPIITPQGQFPDVAVNFSHAELTFEPPSLYWGAADWNTRLEVKICAPLGAQGGFFNATETVVSASELYKGFDPDFRIHIVAPAVTNASVGFPPPPPPEPDDGWNEATIVSVVVAIVSGVIALAGAIVATVYAVLQYQQSQTKKRMQTAEAETAALWTVSL